jgi:uncharacterized protein YggE
MKNYLLLLVLFPLLTFGQVPNSEKSITVIGVSEMEIEPDLITISMSLQETENIKKESDIVTAENKFINFLTSIGVNKEKFVINRFSAREQLGTKFKLSKVYKLTIQKTSLLDTIVSKCFELGMENVFVSNIDHSEIDMLRSELLNQALNSAKAKAEIISKNMNISLGKVLLVNETYRIVGERINNYDNNVFMLEDVVAVGYGSTKYNSTRTSSTINLQKLHLSKTVIVKFEIN